MRLGYVKTKYGRCAVKRLVVRYRPVSLDWGWIGWGTLSGAGASR